MGKTTVELDVEDRNEFRQFKEYYGWTYGEALQELLGAWPDESWADGDSPAATLAELEERLAKKDDAIEKLARANKDLNRRVSALEETSD